MVTRHRRARRWSGVSRSPPARSRRKQLTARRQLRAGLDECLEVLLGHVVVVTLETSARDPCALGERVQLVVAHVADQVRPATPSEPPDRLVDQNCHCCHCAVASRP